MPKTVQTPSVEAPTRGELINLANKLLEQAAAQTQNRNDHPKFAGSPRDPVVRKAAAMMLNRLHNIEKLSFEEIAALFGCSRERVFQLHQMLVEKTKQAA